MSLTGEIALVTGASRGIGQAIAGALADAGATVIGTATSAAGAAAIGETLGPRGGAGKVLDIGDRGACEALVKEIAGEHGGVSILVNNAGITRDNLTMRLSDREWDEVIDTNLGGVHRLSRSCLRGMMKARHGRIINIASVVGHTGNAGQANYAAAKAGVTGYTRSLAREVGSRGITVNCVAPGFIETDMTRALPESSRLALLEQIPTERFGEVSEVAAACVFLASSGAAYITGQTLHVNGGMYMG